MSQTKAQLIDTLVASLLPASDSAVDIGSNAVRFANIYGDTLYGNGANLTGINTDLVSDTSPQLGGNLDVNTKNILFGDSASASDDRLIFGAGQDLQIYHDGSQSVIKNATGNLDIITGSTSIDLQGNDGSETLAKFQPNGAVELYYDNDKKIETASAGVNFIGSNSDQLQWQKANNLLKFRDGTKAVFGEGDDLQIYGGEGGTGAVVNSANGDLFFRHGSDEQLILRDDGAVELYYNNSKKFETYSNGVRVYGELLMQNNSLYLNDNAKLRLGTGQDLNIYHDGSHSIINNITGSLQVQDAGTEKFRVSGTGTSFKDDIFIANDNDKINIGAGNDLQIYHDGTNSILTNSTGNLQIKSTSEVLLQSDASETMVRGVPNNTVELRYDNVKKLETVAGGVKTNDNNYMGFGNSNDLQILHDGTTSRIHSTAHPISIRSGGQFGVFKGDGSEAMLTAQVDGAVELYHDNTQRFTTSSAGVGMVQGGDKFTWPASSGAGPELFNAGSSNRDLDFNIDNEHKYRFHQNGILYQKGANSSNGGAYSSPSASYPVRVWLSFNDEDNITNGVGGVSSVSDTGTGTFTINFGTSFPDDNYAMTATSGGSGGSRGDDSCITHGATNPGTGSIGIRTRKFTDNNFTNSESAMFIFVR